MDEYNFNTFNYFFSSLIISCCFVIILPNMSNNVGTLLFCYFFIALAAVGLFLNWYFKENKNNPTQETVYRPGILMYIAPSLLFILISIIYAFVVISTYSLNIKQGFVTTYYYKFSIITIWLFLIECLLLYNLYAIINKLNDLKDENNTLKINMIGIICFCFLNYFVIWSNAIGLASFSADG